MKDAGGGEAGGIVARPRARLCSDVTPDSDSGMQNNDNNCVMMQEIFQVFSLMT